MPVVYVLVGVVLALWYFACFGPPQPITAPPRETKVIYTSHINNSCRQWYVVAKGDNQWQVATRFAGYDEKTQWLRQMRWQSNLAADDESVHPGQRLCVRW